MGVSQTKIRGALQGWLTSEEPVLFIHRTVVSLSTYVRWLAASYNSSSMALLRHCSLVHSPP